MSKTTSHTPPAPAPPPPPGGVQVRLIGPPEAVDAAVAWLAGQCGDGRKLAVRRPAPQRRDGHAADDLVLGTAIIPTPTSGERP